MSMRVRVYYNLRTKRWSIKAMSGSFKGKVIAHAEGVMLSDAKTVVSEKGRQRVMREKRKNVHAYIDGTLEAVQGWRAWRMWACPDGVQLSPHMEDVEAPGAPWEYWERVYYNPYKVEHFVWYQDDASTLGTHLAYVKLFDDGQVWAVRPPVGDV